MTQAAANAEGPQKPKRAWFRLHRSTYVVLLLVAVVLALANVPGQFVVLPTILRQGKYGPHFEMEGRLEHGWPATYLLRYPEYGPPSARTFSVTWSSIWSLTADVLQFNLARLALDVGAALCIMAAAGALFEWWRRQRRRLFQVHIRDLLVLTALAAVVLAWVSMKAQAYRTEQKAVAELEWAPDEYQWQRGGPTWLRRLIGDSPFRIFDRLVDVSIGNEDPELVRRFRHLKRLEDRPGDTLPYLRDLPRLEDLDLFMADVDDDDLRHLEHCTSLQELSLCATGVTDKGLSHLVGLTELRNLDLARNAIGNEGLRHLAGLTNLEMLILWETDVTDAGLGHLRGLENLRSLHLDGTNVTAAGLVHLQALTGLEELVIDWEKITAAGLVHVKGLTNLRFLYLSDAKIGDAEMAHLAGLSRLQELSLQLNNVTDRGTVHLKGLKNLKRLDLGNTEITDAGLVYLKGLAQLEWVVLTGTRVSHDGIKTLQKALPTCKVEWLAAPKKKKQ
ncbi:MAG: leucine-rich repeat domain-containing protein [Planctomycetota bacterium]|jgi:Leucine-rich repeat (LRR) protein